MCFIVVLFRLNSNSSVIDKFKYEKLTNFCAYSERCRKDVAEKCRKLEIPQEEFSAYLQLLEEDGFLSEKRYAASFVRSKANRSWGPKKIEMGLKAKGISVEVFQPLIEDLQKPLLIEKMQVLIDRKVKSIKGETASDRKQKLIRFLLGKGFAYDLIKEAIGTRSF
ncbi:MAG: RecX family transcriptional regulator [Chitinophagales bacterium]|nr:RecX family transcriptional regulator [Chitinophagales bacterium]